MRAISLLPYSIFTQMASSSPSSQSVVDIFETTPLLVANSDLFSGDLNTGRRLLQAERFLRQDRSRRLMLEPSMLVREAAAEQLEESQSDWAYSKPVVVLDVVWDFFFVIVAATVLVLSHLESPETPLRVWIVGYATQCVVHMVCVCVEFKRRQNRPFSGLSSGEGGIGGAGSSRHSSQYVSLADHLNEEGTRSVVKHVECVNTMLSFIWWIVGFYWVSTGGQTLAHASPQLYWLCIVFLGFDVFFVVFCVALACIIGIALLLSSVYYCASICRGGPVEKKYLYPSAPPLTRYKEQTTIPVLKRKFIECMPLDSNVHDKLNSLTISKLCVRMNTLKYIQKQIDILEDGIRSSWTLVRQSSDKNCAKEQQFGTSTCNDQIDGLFNTTFDIVRDTVANAISKICDFVGAKAVFWDLRHEFLFGLYCGSVETSRVDGVLTHIDTVLGHVCNFIDKSLRDTVVFSICQASMEGFAWVLLDGVPSRAFCDSDIVLLEDDLSALKEFFVADNEGLPQSGVQKESKVPEQILNLYSLQTETIIQKLMAASEPILLGRDSHDYNYRCLNNAHTFVRVLCHKKDREASKFLKRQYQLPMSSEYEETPSTDPTSQSPLRSNLSNKSTSFRWNDTHSAFTHNTFTSFKKKLQEATSELRNVGW